MFEYAKKKIRQKQFVKDITDLAKSMSLEKIDKDRAKEILEFSVPTILPEINSYTPFSERTDHVYFYGHDWTADRIYDLDETLLLGSVQHALYEGEYYQSDLVDVPGYRSPLTKVSHHLMKDLSKSEIETIHKQIKEVMDDINKIEDVDMIVYENIDLRLIYIYQQLESFLKEDYFDEIIQRFLKWSRMLSIVKYYEHKADLPGQIELSDHIASFNVTDSAYMDIAFGEFYTIKDRTNPMLISQMNDPLSKYFRVDRFYIRTLLESEKKDLGNWDGETLMQNTNGWYGYDF
tara:strand:+ start:80 stop:952 length:873 start_codon:yes stop_codon:yes gene_type:complete